MANVKSYSRKSKTGKIHRVGSHYRKNPEISSQYKGMKISKPKLKSVKFSPEKTLGLEDGKKKKEVKQESKELKGGKDDFVLEEGNYRHYYRVDGDSVEIMSFEFDKTSGKYLPYAPTQKTISLTDFKELLKNRPSIKRVDDILSD